MLLLSASCNPTASFLSHSFDSSAKAIESFTVSEYLEDYDQFWDELYSSFPFFGVLERQGIDYKTVQKETRASIESCKEISTFIADISIMIGDLDHFAHLSVFSNYNTYVQALHEYTEAAKSHLSNAGYQEWVTTLESPQSIRLYEYLRLNPIDQLSTDLKADNDIAPLKTLLFPEIKVGYIRIDSFVSAFIEKDHDSVDKFFRETSNYDHIIIDISRNGGGDTGYYHINLLSPLGGNFMSTSYAFLMDSPLTQRFWLDFFDGYAPRIYQPIEQWDQTVVFKNPVDLVNLSYYCNYITSTESYDSNTSKKIENTARRWLIVDKPVYSASDNFAAFCKASGWATVVGNRTGGDGLGRDPILVSLKNTGVIVRFSVIYGLNPDGTCNAEMGTAPDIQCAPGETPFETCLKQLEKLGIDISEIYKSMD